MYGRDGRRWEGMGGVGVWMRLVWRLACADLPAGLLACIRKMAHL